MEIRDKDGLTEAEYLAAYAQKNYPRPYLTADLVLLAQDPLRVLLIRRQGHPYLGRWALPGGFAEPGESTYETALRELSEETGVDARDCRVSELGLFSKPGRDPRGWVVSDVFTAAVRCESAHPVAGDDAADARWFAVSFAEDGGLLLTADALRLTGRDLAFDHAEILARALKR